MPLAERGRNRPPVMTDVAQLAGVSHQTVSRVLNDHPNVRPQTRELVLAAITELGYRPNAAARTLVTRRTHTLGVISFDTTLYGPASMLYGIERAARDNYFVAIASVPTLDRRSVLDAVDRETRERFERTWLDLGSAPAQRRVLAALANGPQSLYSKTTLLAFELDKSAAQQATQALIYGGDVMRVDGRFVIVDPLLERWLQRTQH